MASTLVPAAVLERLPRHEGLLKALEDSGLTSLSTVAGIVLAFGGYGESGFLGDVHALVVHRSRSKSKHRSQDPTSTPGKEKRPLPLAKAESFASVAEQPPLPSSRKLRPEPEPDAKELRSPPKAADSSKRQRIEPQQIHEEDAKKGSQQRSGGNSGKKSPGPSQGKTLQATTVRQSMQSFKGPRGEEEEEGMEEEEVEEVADTSIHENITPRPAHSAARIPQSKLQMKPSEATSPPQQLRRQLDFDEDEDIPSLPSQAASQQGKPFRGPLTEAEQPGAAREPQQAEGSQRQQQGSTPITRKSPGKLSMPVRAAAAAAPAAGGSPPPPRLPGAAASSALPQPLPYPSPPPPPTTATTTAAASAAAAAPSGSDVKGYRKSILTQVLQLRTLVEDIHSVVWPMNFSQEGSAGDLQQSMSPPQGGKPDLQTRIEAGRRRQQRSAAASTAAATDQQVRLPAVATSHSCFLPSHHLTAAPALHTSRCMQSSVAEFLEFYRESRERQDE